MNDMIKELSNQAYDELVKETGNIVVFARGNDARL